ncbi:TlpA family protein disulfide reductase [Algoriphagus formosus]|nr:thioredoxin-like domain-containing protein [Algoriphagus aquimaris]
MKKILLTCFLGGLCLFQKAIKPIRSWPNLIRSHLTFLIKNLFRSNEGGAYFTPRYEEYISPKAYFAECIPLAKVGRGNRNKHISTICLKFAFAPISIFLLLFFGFNTSSIGKVADSPPGVGLVSADSPYPGREEYSTPAHKGKDSEDNGNEGYAREVEDIEEVDHVGSPSSVNFCSKSLVPVLCLDLDGGPVTASREFLDLGARETVVTTDHSDSLSLDKPVLLYGELLNPDSLGPLSITVTPFYVAPRSTFLQEEVVIQPVKGEFYDGVMNGRTEKFETVFQLSDRPAYVSMVLGNRVLLDEYLVLPEDSIKLKLDLSRNTLVFAGKNRDFYEAQFAIKRLDHWRAFDSPRQLIIPESSKLLQRPGSQEKIEFFKGRFGSELLILQPGKESLDYLISQAEKGRELLAPQFEVLDFYREKLSVEQLDLLKAEIYGRFYFGILSTFRKFHYPYVENRFEEEDRLLYRQRLQELVDRIGEEEFLKESQLISAGFLDLELERLILEALWENRSFLELVQEKHSAEFADRLQAAYLSNYLASHTGQAEILLDYLTETESYPWRDRLEKLKSATIPGDPLEDAELISLSGDSLQVSELPAQPTLVYFYFSTCAHSANYFNNYLFPVYQALKNQNVHLIAISVDEDVDLWKGRIDKYSHPSIPNYNLRGISKQRWKELYEINSFPRVMFLDEESRIRSFDIRPLGETKEELLQELQKKFLHDQSQQINSTTKTNIL